MTSRADHADQIDRTGWTCPTPSHTVDAAGRPELCEDCPEFLGTLTDPQLEMRAGLLALPGALNELRARVRAGIDDARAAIAVAYHANPSAPGPLILANMKRGQHNRSYYGTAFLNTLYQHLDGRSEAGHQVIDAIRTHRFDHVPAVLDQIRAARTTELDALGLDPQPPAEWLRGYLAVITTKLSEWPTPGQSQAANRTNR